jgi:hypothetical protein
VVIGTYDTPGTAYGVALDSTGTRVYVADGAAGLKILSLSNPQLPTLVGSLSIAGTIVRSVAVAGGVVCLANQQGTLEVVDVTNPSLPRRIGWVLLSGGALDVAVEGTRAALLSSSGSDYLDVVDISNPARPVLAGSVAIGPTGTSYGMDLVGGRAYVAASTQGLKIYNVAGGGTPVLLGAGYTIGNALDADVDGSMAYVADFPATIDIVDLAQ